jgi:ABC-2 type transport system permease protein
MMLTIVKLLPSYWLAQAGKVALGGSGWPVEAWLVVAAWTAAMAALAVVAYRRDTQRV